MNTAEARIAEEIVKRLIAQQQAVKRMIGELPEPPPLAAPAPYDHSNPVPIFKVQPSYSEAARRAHIEGTVYLETIIDRNGIPTDIRVTGSLGHGLDEQAIDALKQWRFKPATKNGQPVPAKATLFMNFRLS